ncbi:MAG: tRNA (N6-threonylcarbamoyladenosine(37)-N6)-methyltransferase TrmO [Bacteroidales bacterium]|nr:tRNA (N6-threonylcarbamoyladenosine(37)-N6)-methyltransferase TrmO [Bacteroidales bacterium]
MEKVSFEPIGLIHTPFTGEKKLPRQGRFEPEKKGWVEVFPEFEKGLSGLEGFSHAYLIFHFHRSKDYELIQVTPRHHVEKGVFAIRSPRRPNPIGLTIVKLEKIENNRIYFSGPDMIDGTPLLDIKPYTTEIDCYPDADNGWLKM